MGKRRRQRTSPRRQAKTARRRTAKTRARPTKKPARTRKAAKKVPKKAPKKVLKKPAPSQAGNGRLRELFAAVDLGSNSFQLLVAHMVGGQPHVVDRLRERVALAAGLDDRQRLTAAAQKRALDALKRFGQRVRDMPRANVRAVGTNALRQARNADSFLNRARRVLGHRIEVISGREEARLIHMGVAHSLADDSGRRLVIDIGGGSTECILGERLEALEADSLYMGCVTYSKRFFPRGEVTPRRMDEAILAAQLELQSLAHRYLDVGWQRCIGSSGTILSLESILRGKGWEEHGISASGLERLRGALVDARRVRKLALGDVSAERMEVLPGGLAILIGVFRSLEIDRMAITPSSMREGLLYDLLGRIRHEDARERTVRRMTRRYHVDEAQAQRVEVTALSLFDQVAEAWGLDGEHDRQLLGWSARLHEIGLSIAYSGHHKHGAYILEHADMPGFSLIEQQVLGIVLGGQRRKLRTSGFQDLPASRIDPSLGLCVLLRLAVCLNRSRSERQAPKLKLVARRRRLELAFPRGWLARHPLTRADLEQEALALKAADLRLTVG